MALQPWSALGGKKDIDDRGFACNRGVSGQRHLRTRRPYKDEQSVWPDRGASDGGKVCTLRVCVGGTSVVDGAGAVAGPGVFVVGVLAAVP